MTPPITPGAVRPTILDALDYANALGDLPKSAVRAFVEEHGDITLAELELNSLARMELRLMFDEICRRIPDVQPAGEVQLLRSNFINGLKHLPLILETL